MARIIVTADPADGRPLRALGDEAPVLLDEHVDPVHLDTSHAAEQLMQRLAWAVSDAEAAQRAQSGAARPARRSALSPAQRA
ncbi:MAG TPA: hypothetical protein VGX51_01010 [Solirubrobacteraceae bacterium]|jgi:hypothetical protein|nr:hypothetical protein [Solirubrobacteraceae bacterium]